MAKLPRLPTAVEGALKYLGELSAALSKEFDKRTPDGEVRRELFLQSPDGGVWQVNVADDGTLSTTKVGQQ